MASGKAPRRRDPKARSRKVKEASRWIGQPVCVVLNDGECYIGTVHAIHNHKLILAETRNCGTVNLSDRSNAPEVQVSGLLDSLIGGIGALNSFGTMATSFFKPMLSGPSGAGAGSVNEADSASTEGPSSSGPAGGGPPGGFVSFKQILPTFQVGLKMVKAIMPLMGMFKI